MSNKKTILIIMFLVVSSAFIALLAGIAINKPASAEKPEWSAEYWNQVHVSEYLAEKTFNGTAKVLRSGLGRVVIAVDGRAYEYSCKGSFNCTEGFTNEEVGNHYIWFKNGVLNNSWNETKP